MESPNKHNIKQIAGTNTVYIEAKKNVLNGFKAIKAVIKRDSKMNHLDLFSGIGGFALAARWAGINTVAFCEIEPFAQKVLKKEFPNNPNIFRYQKIKKE